MTAVNDIELGINKVTPSH